ncbi:hypothetical protein KM043_002111 [Ampulex compressa]|nr:hypothetical protein KM043_002111 [Ampulex compressa]
MSTPSSHPSSFRGLAETAAETWEFMVLRPADFRFLPNDPSLEIPCPRRTTPMETQLIFMGMAPSRYAPTSFGTTTTNYGHPSFPTPLQIPGFGQS